MLAKTAKRLFYDPFVICLSLASRHIAVLHFVFLYGSFFIVTLFESASNSGSLCTSVAFRVIAVAMIQLSATEILYFALSSDAVMISMSSTSTRTTGRRLRDRKSSSAAFWPWSFHTRYRHSIKVMKETNIFRSCCLSRRIFSTSAAPSSSFHKARIAEVSRTKDSAVAVTFSFLQALFPPVLYKLF